MQVESRQPVKYILKAESLIGNELRPAGAIVEYDGLPAENLEPTCDEGRKRYAEYLESNRQRVARMIEANKESGVGDADQFAKQFQKALAEMNAQHEERMIELRRELAETQAKMGEQMSAAFGQALAQLFPNGLPGAAPAEPVKAETEQSDTAEAPAKRTR